MAIEGGGGNLKVTKLFRKEIPRYIYIYIFESDKII